MAIRQNTLLRMDTLHMCQQDGNLSQTRIQINIVNMALLLYDYNDDKLIVLDREYNPVRVDGETRCDLHPRVSPSGRYVSIDCIIKGKTYNEDFRHIIIHKKRAYGTICNV